MKIAVIIVRVLLGLMFLLGSLAFFFKLGPQPELKGNMKLFMDGVQATGYFMPLLKATELLCGLAFVAGRFVPLATVVIFPVTLNILLFLLFVAPEGQIMGVLIMAANLFLAYAYRKNYATLLVAKPQ